MSIEFNATKRDVQGSSASRRLRRAGRTPGIIYGGSAAAINVEFDHNEIYQALRKEAFYSSVLTANVDGQKELVLLRDVQRHAYKQIVLHVDFQRVDANQKLHQRVPLHFINEDICPGVKLSGKHVARIITEVDVSCLPAKLPAFIEVDLKTLGPGESIHISQLVLPEGVEVAHAQGGDPVIVSVGGKAPAATDAE
jgi:large subunit ribosomal protein L25